VKSLALLLTLLSPTGNLIESSVAVSGNRAVIAVINMGTPGGIMTFASADAGLTWSDAITAPLTIAGKTYRFAGDPTLVTLDDGAFGLAYVATEKTPGTPIDFGATALVFSRSDDGVKWSAAQAIVADNVFSTILVADKPWLTVDRTRGTAHIVWTRISPLHQLVVARSTDHGAHWSAPAGVTPEGGDSFGELGVLANGTIALTSFTSDDGFLSRISTDGGTSFGAAQVIGPDAGSPSVASATNTFSSRAQMLVTWRNDFYCAYPAKNGVFFTKSHDGGTTWSPPLRLAGAAGDALMPSLAVEDATGQIVVDWLDSRDDASGKTLRLYAARSTDGGASFESARPFSEPFPGGGKLGDYNTTASLGSGVYLTAFSSAGGFLNTTRIVYPSIVHRRAVSH